MDTWLRGHLRIVASDGIEIDVVSRINPRSSGVVPVVILGSGAFDVTVLDVTTLRFGPGAAPTAHDLTDSSAYDGHQRDVNLDGFPDLVTHYRTGDTGILCGDDSATLTGETTTGNPVAGADAIHTIGCHARRGPGARREGEARFP